MKVFQLNPNRYIHYKPPSPTKLNLIVLGKSHFFHLFMTLGPPCSGKTTQAKLLAEKFGLRYLDLEDSVTDHMSRQTDIGHKVLWDLSFISSADFQKDSQW